MILENVMRKKKKEQVHLLLKCKTCGALTTYEADLFRQHHLREYFKQGYVVLYCGSRKCSSTDRFSNGMFVIKGLFTEKISQIDKETSILRDLKQKKWG